MKEITTKKENLTKKEAAITTTSMAATRSPTTTKITKIHTTERMKGLAVTYLYYFK